MATTIYSRELLRKAASLYRWPLGDVVGSGSGSMIGQIMTAQPCGSTIKLSIQIDPEGAVSALGMDCQACAFGQGSAAIMADYIAGQNMHQIAEMSRALTALLQRHDDAEAVYQRWPDFELLAAAADYPARHPAIMLPYKAALATLAGDDAR